MLRSRWMPVLFAALASVPAPQAFAQTKGAVRTKYVEPVFPEDLLKTQRQGNVLLAGRIDVQGRLVDVKMLAASLDGFVQPAFDAVKKWQFRPAMQDGKAIEIFANVGVRFRIQNDKRGAIEAPILGDLAISPADASGRATAPEGFPIRRGKDPALRADAELDIPPAKAARTFAATVEVVSPTGRKFPIFQPPVAVAAGATEVRIPVVAQIGKDWEDGVWTMRFTVNGAPVGGGQFWLAADPAHYHFVIPGS